MKPKDGVVDWLPETEAVTLDVEFGKVPDELDGRMPEEPVPRVEKD